MAIKAKPVSVDWRFGSIDLDIEFLDDTDGSVIKRQSYNYGANICEGKTAAQIKNIIVSQIKAEIASLSAMKAAVAQIQTIINTTVS